MTRAIHAIISGRVQGVAFRWSTQLKAQQLGLHGWVRNLDNGDVEVWAQGDADKIHSLIEWLHHGPDYARVDSVEISVTPPSSTVKGAFAIR
ncbi:MAG: acylphosphatase [Actinomycetaceae bacterium]|nr:acylphosphatase [Actinomycetaceae bacterium]